MEKFNTCVPYHSGATLEGKQLLSEEKILSSKSPLQVGVTNSYNFIPLTANVFLLE